MEILKKNYIFSFQKEFIYNARKVIYTLVEKNYSIKEKGVLSTEKGYNSIIEDDVIQINGFNYTYTYKKSVIHEHNFKFCSIDFKYPVIECVCSNNGCIEFIIDNEFISNLNIDSKLSYLKMVKDMEADIKNYFEEKENV